MIRLVFAHMMAVVLAMTGLSFASARGTQPEAGVEMVICAGVELVTIHVGADGQPVEESHLCPDGNAMFLATFALPDLPEPSWQLVGIARAYTAVLPQSAPELVPSARGPPQLV